MIHVHFRKNKFEALCKNYIFDHMTEVAELVTCSRCHRSLELLRRTTDQLPRRKIIDLKNHGGKVHGKNQGNARSRD